MKDKKFYFAQKGLVFSRDHKYLLFIKTTSKYMPDKLNGKLALPGGKVNFGEEIDKACIREILEETGITVSPGLPVYTWAWNYQKENEMVEIVANARLCAYISGTAQKDKKKEKEVVIDCAFWVLIENIKQVDCIADEWPAIDFVIKNQDLVKRLLSIKNFVKTGMYKSK